MHPQNKFSFFHLIFSSFFQVIRTLKGIFFRALLHFSTLRYGHILKLCESVYNQKPHSSLYGYSPFQVHWDSAIASEVSKKNFAREKNKQALLRDSIYSEKSHNVYKPGDRVLLRSMKKTFHKSSSIHHPNFMPGVFTIESVDSRCFPRTYQLREISNKKRFVHTNEL